MADGQVEHIPWEAPEGLALGRSIRHDARNRSFAVAPLGVPSRDIRHRNYGRKLNQGGVGACTCFTAAHATNFVPVRPARRPARTSNWADAMRWYSRATVLDPFEGTYPPTDTGSSGQAACQAMVEEGIIAGYEWAFGYDAGLAALAAGPIMQGTWWTRDMFTPDADGRVRPTGADAGGHEYLWVGYDVSSKRSWFLNSWGAWGKFGYFYLTEADHRGLLERDGDLVRPLLAKP